MSLSIEHEAPIELCREHPEVISDLLRELLQVRLPAYSRVRMTDPNTRAVLPTGQRSDAAVVFEDQDRPVLAAILEPQGSIDKAKWYSWPKYLADLHAEVQCDTYLIVLALSRGVAAWAQRPIASFQPPHGLRLLVVGPQDLPRVTSVADARQRTWLAALSALLHANEPDGVTDAAHVLQATREGQGPNQAWWLYQLLRAIMSEEHCQRLQEVIMFSPEVYLPKTEFEREQYRQGKAEFVLRLLTSRQISVSEAERARILKERDVATLDRWFDRALSARATAELF